jgi:hypothetical protein
LARWEKGSLGLFLNQGDGTFSEGTTGDIALPGYNASNAAWGDYDRDGHLDLHVSNYGSANWLFHNRGDGGFARVSGSPFDGTSANSMGCAWSDYDNYGIPDLFVGNSTRNAAYLFHGQPGGGFERIQRRHPTTLSTGYWLGCDWGDFDNDGDPDLYVTSNGLGDVLYLNEGDGTFSLAAGVVPSTGSGTVHPAWVDYDNDGWLDLYVTRAMNPSLPGSLFHNSTDGTFEKILDTVIATETFPRAGCCWGDYDNDGFQDLFIAGGGFDSSHPNVLYRNTGNTNAWLKFKLVGTASTRSGIGAKVRVRATIGGQTFWQLREIAGGSGSGGAQNGLIAHFGLGDATIVEQVRIDWPSGVVQEMDMVVPGQTLTMVCHLDKFQREIHPFLTAAHGTVQNGV